MVNMAAFLTHPTRTVDDNDQRQPGEAAEPAPACNQLRTLSIDRQDELLEAFAVFDKEARGRIPVKELPSVLQMMGFIVSEAQLQELLASIFSAPRENIGQADFLKLLTRLWQARDETKELLATFDLFDADSDGYLTPGDICYIMGRLGVRLTVEEAEQMVRMADSDGDGRLSYEEFAWALTQASWEA